MIIKVGQGNDIINLGIIGFVSKETPSSTTTHLNDLDSEDYVKSINEESLS